MIIVYLLTKRQELYDPSKTLMHFGAKIQTLDASHNLQLSSQPQSNPKQYGHSRSGHCSLSTILHGV